VIKPGMLVGRSVHNLDEAGQAEAAGADYVFLGPVFQTATHPEAKGMGLDHFREAVLRSSIPVIAIGGIDVVNVKLIVKAGGRGAAAIRAFYQVPDAADTARAFRAAFPS
jgi:thiamine-phosphate pyrophosphorylase